MLCEKFINYENKNIITNGGFMSEENGIGGKVLAEIIGTFLLIIMGDGVVANVGLAPRLAPPGYDWVTICFGWGLAVAVAVYVTGGISGAHINPAVTIAMAVRGKFPWKDVVPYIIGQFIGAFLGAAGVYLIYYDGLVAAGMPNVWCTGPGSIFSKTYWGAAVSATPVGTYSIATCFIAEVVGTMLLLLGICALTDERNQVKGAGGVGSTPLLIGILVATIGLTVGGASGWAINPARDLGPRIFGALVGTKGLFDGWYWIGPPVIGTIIGGILGVLIYDYLVAPYLPKE